MDPGPNQPVFDRNLMNFNFPVVVDGKPAGTDFGYIVQQALDEYEQGDTVKVGFISGNPRNNLMTERSFLEVQQKQADGSWTTVLTDANWETK